ncbi:hypothetical protein Ancab_008024 [Ancistrocladus abbreviatus]
MDNSCCSYPNRGVEHHDCLSEESGWTEYLEDFEAYNGNPPPKQQKWRQDGGEEYSNCSSFVGASLVSDAGSGPEWKHRNGLNTVSMSMPRKLKFINKRIDRESNAAFDDSLEDTASSPVNSPKMALSFKRMDVNSGKADDCLDATNFPGKGDCQDQDMKKNEQGCDMDADGRKKDELTELKKKGLCLVPVSMLINYIA